MINELNPSPKNIVIDRKRYCITFKINSAFIIFLILDFEDPFTNWDHGAKLCWTLAAFRNFFAEADFSTIGTVD